MSETLPVPAKTREDALQRVKAYCQAVHDLYDEKDPEPEGLIIDDQINYEKGFEHNYLLLADLELIVNGET